MNWFIPSPACFFGFLATLVTICRAQATEPSVHVTTGVVFPADNEVLWRTVSNVTHLLGVSILAYCLGRRTDKFAAQGLTSIPIARWLVILLFIDSWLFLFAAGLLISGVGLSLNPRSCEAGVFLCIVLYAISKILIYWFLVEKVHLVHPHPSHTRCKSPPYRLCMMFVIGYGIIIVIAVNSRIAFIRDGHHGSGPTDGVCVIGLGRAGSISVLVYDLLLNVFFTCMFLYPLYKSNRPSAKLRAIARRTLIAALVALITSAINICILTILHGEELGWICLASCGVDVAVNAVAVYSVTASVDDQESEPSDLCEKTYTRSNKGILGIDHHAIPSATRSVHFSPDTTRQSRRSSLREFKEPENSLAHSEGTVPESNRTQDGMAAPFSSDRMGNSKIDVRVRPSTYTTLPSLGIPPDPGEETSVEIRHEAPLKKISRRANIVSLNGSTTSKRRSQSVEVTEIPNSTVISLSHAPSTLEEARERIRVLSALIEITGEKSKTQADPLEVSVVTQTDQRIEVRKRPPRNDTFDDYNSRRYDRRGNSSSSSGGL